MRTYPMVTALVRYGTLLAVLVALAAATFGLYLSIAGLGSAFAVGGVLIGGVLFVLLKSYTELVAIIADMMLPK